MVSAHTDRQLPRVYQSTQGGCPYSSLDAAVCKNDNKVQRRARWCTSLFVLHTRHLLAPSTSYAPYHREHKYGGMPLLQPLISRLKSQPQHCRNCTISAHF